MWTDRQKDGQTWQSQYSLSATFWTYLKMMSYFCTHPMCLQIMQRYIFSHQSFCAIEHVFKLAEASLMQCQNLLLLEWYMTIMMLKSSAKMFQLWIDICGKLFMYICIRFITTICNITVNLCWIKIMLSVTKLGQCNNLAKCSMSKQATFHVHLLSWLANDGKNYIWLGKK